MIFWQKITFWAFFGTFLGKISKILPKLKIGKKKINK